jgi:O-antigen ligase
MGLLVSLTWRRGMNINVNLRVFSLIGLIIIITFALVSRGLYFSQELLIGLVLVGVVLLFAVADTVIRGETDFFRFSVDYLITGMVLVYLLSVYGAVSKSDAILGVLKYTGYLAVFYITVQSVRTWRGYRGMMEVILAGAVLVALIGLFSATGVLQYPGAYQFKQIFSTFQYPNALALFVLAASFICLSLWASIEKTSVIELWYIVGLILLSVVLFGTSSRAVWLMYPVFIVGWIFGLYKQQRLVAVFRLGYVLIMSVFISRAFYVRVETGRGQEALIILLGSILLSLAFWLGIQKVNKMIERKHTGQAVKRFWQVLTVAYVVIVVAVYAVYAVQNIPGGWANVVPADLSQQLATVSANDSNLLSRVQLTEDALGIIKDYPLLGTGAGGWAVLYNKYKSMPYTAAEVHNNYAQIAVETGIPGLLIYCSIWVVSFYWAYRLFKHFRRHPKWPLVWGVTIALLAVALHSAIDFDLSLPTLSIITWVLFGLMRNGYLLAHDEGFRLQRLNGGFRLIPVVVGLAVALVLVIPSYRFYKAGILGAEAATAMRAGNISTAESKLRAATQLDPYKGSYLMDLSKIDIIKWGQKGDQALLNQGLARARLALKYEPFNYKLNEGIILCYLSTGMINEAFEVAGQVVTDNPFDIKAYEMMSNLGVQGAMYYQGKGEPARAQDYINKVLGASEEMKRLSGRLAAQGSKEYEYTGMLKMTPRLNLTLGQAYLLAGSFDEGISLLQQSSRTKEADKWLAAVYMVNGEINEANLLIDRWSRESANFRSSVEQVKQFIAPAKN